MQRLLILSLGALAALFPFGVLAQDPSAGTGIDDIINTALKPVTDVVVGIVFYTVNIAGNDIPLILGWLVLFAAFSTLLFGFIQFRAFRHALHLVRGDYSDPKAAGEVSHFQALATALSGTVGLGNIAGVAIAVSIGGPGATFWMIVAGLMGMAAKFAECTMGVHYRNENADGSVSGGPMYYLSKGLAERGMGGFGRFLAAVFAICCIGGSFGGGNMFQANQAFQQFVQVTGGPDGPMADKGWLFGLVIAFLVAIVIIGGIRSIARVTEKIVPFMGITYVLAALVIILMNITAVPEAFALIFQGAFTNEGVAGGAVGALIQGFRRAAFSNEAGIGSAAIAHSAVKTSEPVTEGLVALHEPFIDTVVICTMTALVIVITGMYNAGGGMGGVELTSAAFASAFSWFPYVLALAVILFAFSTMISWSYYGLKCWTYLFGETRAMDLLYKAIFCAFVVLGSAMSLGPVVDFSDSMIFLMAIPNILGLYILSPLIRRLLSSYMTRLRNGEFPRYGTSWKVHVEPLEPRR